MVEVLVVGPADRRTGGIARYITGLRDHLTGHHVRTYNVQPVSGDGLLRFGLGVVAAVFQLAAFPFRRRPEIIHVHTSHWRSFYLSAMYVLIGTHVWRRPVILHVHGSSFDEFIDSAAGVEQRFQSMIFDQCAAVVVLSEYWRDVLSERVDSDRLVVINNAVDTEAITPEYSADVPHLIFISNLLQRKGVIEFLEAIERLATADEVPPFRVTIAGIGPLAAKVEATADQLTAISYQGYISEPEKRELLRRGTIYVLPSHSEGLPLGLLEGMAGGNAVVASTVGSVPEIIGLENGRLVPPRDIDALTAALEELITRPDTVSAMARKNRALAEASYSWSSVTTDIDELYRRVVNDHRAGGASMLERSVGEPNEDR